MATQRVVLSASGTAEGTFVALARRLDDPRAALRKVADAVRLTEAEVFASANSGLWGPLSPKTVKRHGAHRVLIQTGKLQRSLVGKTSQSVTRIGRDEVYVGTRNPTAILQRTGARGHPERDPVPRPKQASVERWAQVFLAALTEEIERVGG